jgi:hypothetical protein
VAINVRVPGTGEWVYYMTPAPNSASPPDFIRVLDHAEIIPNVTHNQNDGSDTTNLAFCDDAALYYLDAVQKSYQIDTPTHARYIGIHPQELDGAIQQVTFQVTDKGSWTIVARNNEIKHYTEPYMDRLLRYNVGGLPGMAKDIADAKRTGALPP